MNYTYRPAWVLIDRPSIFTKGKNLMSLLAKILTKKPAAESISGVAQLEKDLSAAVAAAERRGVPPHAIVSALERAEQAERFRVAAGIQQWSSRTISGNLPD